MNFKKNHKFSFLKIINSDKIYKIYLNFLIALDSFKNINKI